MKKSNLNKSDKILLAVYELEKNRKEGGKITKEELIIKVWKMFPSDFCIRCYLKYPNADISKYFTILFKNNLLKGGFYNFVITSKGRDYAEKLLSGKNYQKEKIIAPSREIISEINRIKNSKIFKYFINGGKDFIESDLFDFLGTSVRSFSNSNKTNFLAKYNLIIKEVIPFCEKIKNKDIIVKKIIDLWNILSNNFKEISEKIKN